MGPPGLEIFDCGRLVCSDPSPEALISNPGVTLLGGGNFCASLVIPIYIQHSVDRPTCGPKSDSFSKFYLHFHPETAVIPASISTTSDTPFFIPDWRPHSNLHFEALQGTGEWAIVDAWGLIGRDDEKEEIDDRNLTARDKGNKSTCNVFLIMQSMIRLSAINSENGEKLYLPEIMQGSILKQYHHPIPDRGSQGQTKTINKHAPTTGGRQCLQKSISTIPSAWIPTLQGYQVKCPQVFSTNHQAKVMSAFWQASTKLRDRKEASQSNLLDLKETNLPLAAGGWENLTNKFNRTLPQKLRKRTTTTLRRKFLALKNMLKPSDFNFHGLARMLAGTLNVLVLLK
ncbi:hypothetical protein BDK51DRAFT_52698 [Blyttiomyces helicus]|uniref:Uncharacterized protein n=1 Tax=Blyttiomyces helicus TaxID=388810 RepID=A0A4P9W6Y0_9FUNG|nr:hypothetical protein BDK51DRAFT_52698 [Blyttiomyces helicus]|eukprot:RKO86748.1 hypothetical protein BDK51DRAFT_52698 [Blyttiomyces helicus]